MGTSIEMLHALAIAPFKALAWDPTRENWIVGHHGANWIYDEGGVPLPNQAEERSNVYLNRLNLSDSPVFDTTPHPWSSTYTVDPMSVDDWLAPVTGRNGVY